MDPHLSIDEKETKRASDLDGVFIEKSITIDKLNLQIQTPFKLLDGKGINPNNPIEKEITTGVENQLFEIAKRVQRPMSWKRFHYLTQEAGNDKISGLNDFFSLKREMQRSGQPVSISPVFFKDPRIEKPIIIRRKGKEERKIKLRALTESEYEGFLYYLHSASSVFVLAPDLKMKKKDGPDVKSYLRFVDTNMDILSSRNSKPIFAPIQIDEPPIEELKEILKHYKRNGYTNIWVNFNSREWCGPYFSKVRSFLEEVDRIFGETRKADGLNNVCIHYSHVKKESDAHIRNDRALSSDIISQFFGGDIIGVNQPRDMGGTTEKRQNNLEKRIARGDFKDEAEYNMLVKANKTRMFHPDSYYYYKIENYPGLLSYDKTALMDDHINRLANSILLRTEIEKTRSYFDEKKKIKPYVKTKAAVKDNTLFNDIFPKTKQQKLTLADALANL